MRRSPAIVSILFLLNNFLLDQSFGQLFDAPPPGSDETVNFDNTLVEPSEINQEQLYDKYDNFPVPKLENVYKAWRPVDYGHPLKDETLYYRPPSVERVRFHAEIYGPQSRSIDDQVFQKAPTRPIVIQAEPKEDPPKSGYSVYGSPDINYSALYTSPKPKTQHKAAPSSHFSVKPPRHHVDPRENPLLFRSALDSRSADTRDYPLLWGHYGREPQSALEPVKSTGLHMIKPPTKKKKKPTEYFYYSDDSPHYKDKLNKRPNKEEHEVDNEIISIDGIVVGPRNSLTTPKPSPVPPQNQPSLKYPEDLQTSASEIRRVAPPNPTTNNNNNKANAVVYSFKNNYGQREHVGVIFDQPPEASQVNKVLPSNKAHVLNPRIDEFRPHTRLHPVNPNRPKKPPKANFIPLLDKKPVNKKKEVSFPLGNPFISPLLKARPEFFPALNYPPLYKTRPAKLEGSFGPKLPPKPEPDVILFPDEELPGVQREEPNDNFQPISAPVQSRESTYVYKSVRDMDYSRPRDILSVRPSGELYIPEPGTHNKPLGDPEPRVPILPGVSTLEEFEAIQDEADDRLWLPDFSDTDGQSEGSESSPPTLSDIFGAGINQPLDLDTDSSIQSQVIFKENSYKRPGSSFKFPGQSTLDQPNNRQPPPALRRPSGAVKVQQPPSGVKLQQVQPNYSVVIGLTYDDNTDEVVDYEDFDNIEQTTEKPFGKKELYELCVAEVPKHLHYELCGYIRDGKIPPSRSSAKNIQPLDSRLIQGAPLVKPNNYDPFAGIPTELPVQIQQNSPLVITSNSRVKVYKPYEDTPVVQTTTSAPPTTITTTTAAPPSVQNIQPYQETRQRRPLVFNKRDPNTGESRLSQPFEYFNRLTQFFSNRIRTPSGGQRQRFQGPPPPRLQRQRLPS